jgi:hypothetical protein
MRALQDIGGEELQWVKPKWTRPEFELRAGDAVVATLRWTGGSRAEGTWAGGQYRFSREGWFRPRILVRRAAPEDTGEPLATFAYRGAILSLPDGRSFRWAKPKRWTAERVWLDGAATELIRFRPQRAGAVVTMQPRAATLPELAMLLLLGQYLFGLAAQDAVAATSASIVPVISG